MFRLTSVCGCKQFCVSVVRRASNGNESGAESCSTEKIRVNSHASRWGEADGRNELVFIEESPDSEGHRSR